MYMKRGEDEKLWKLRRPLCGLNEPSQKKIISLFIEVVDSHFFFISVKKLFTKKSEQEFLKDN